MVTSRVANYRPITISLKITLRSAPRPRQLKTKQLPMGEEYNLFLNIFRSPIQPSLERLRTHLTPKLIPLTPSYNKNR